MKSISEQATTYVFKLVMTQVEYDMTKENVVNTDTLTEIEQYSRNLLRRPILLKQDAVNANITPIFQPSSQRF